MKAVLQLRLRVLQVERQRLATKGEASRKLEKKAREIVAELREMV